MAKAAKKAVKTTSEKPKANTNQEAIASLESIIASGLPASREQLQAVVDSLKAS